jgi:hypothetical protein
MARYFFNLTGDPYKRDEEGTQLDDNTAAKRHGVVCVAQLMRDDPTALVNGNELDLEITDERGLVLFVINVCATNAPAGARVAQTDWV